MGKVLFSYSQSQDAWRTPDPGIIPNTFWCWPAADYEALEAESASLRANCDAQQKAIEHLTRQFEAALREIARLRKPLEFIAGQKDKVGNWAVEIAKAALEASE